MEPVPPFRAGGELPSICNIVGGTTTATRAIGARVSFEACCWECLSAEMREWYSRRGVDDSARRWREQGRLSNRGWKISEVINLEDRRAPGRRFRSTKTWYGRADVARLAFDGPRVQAEHLVMASRQRRTNRMMAESARFTKDAHEREVIREHSRDGAGKCVYWIQAVEGGPIKIGAASDPTGESRLKGLQTGNPNALRIVGVVPGHVKLEAWLHKKARSYGARVRGEWFEEGEAMRLLRMCREALGVWA